MEQLPALIISVSIVLFLFILSLVVIFYPDEEDSIEIPSIDTKFHIQENKKIKDYRDIGITCEILEHDNPCCVWNKDEKKIVQGWDTQTILDHKIVPKSGNIMCNALTYSELNDDFIKSINSKYGIIIIPNHETIQYGSSLQTQYYRFSIIE